MTDHTAVEVFDGAKLQFQVTVMSCFVACFYVYEYEVVIAQSVDSGFIIGIGKSGSARYDDVVQSGVMANATYQVYSRNHVASLYLWIHLLKRLHLWTISASPRPYAVSLVFAFGTSCYVERSIGKHFLRFQNQVVQQVSGLLCRHSVG